MYKIVKKYVFSKVWTLNKVLFDFVVSDNKLVVAYYDESKELVMVSLDLNTGEKKERKLPITTNWDSHRYIVLSCDAQNCLHLSGNMHCIPLIYWRSEKPLDIDSLMPIDFMTGINESRTTYPKFLTGANGEFLFHYRSGGSGNGIEIYNIYDYKSKKWTPFLDQAMADGEGARSIYFADPEYGPDGYFHLLWMWRNTPDCETNHDLSYARSKNLKDWEDVYGTPISLPICYNPESALIVDKTQVNGGLINMNNAIGFDNKGRVVLSYHRYDENNHSQIYNARFANGKWEIIKTSNWRSHWVLSKNGSVVCDVNAGKLEYRNGKLIQRYHNLLEGDGQWELNEDLQVISEKKQSFEQVPEELLVVKNADPRVKSRFIRKESPDGKVYVMRWESLDSYRDKEQPKPWPSSSTLEVFEITPMG